MTCSEGHHWQFLSFRLMAFLHSIAYRNFCTENLIDQNLLTDTIDRVVFRVIGQKLHIATGEVKT